jgi:hypothetical protein
MDCTIYLHYLLGVDRERTVPATFLAIASNSERAQAEESKLREKAACSINFFSCSVSLKRKYVDFIVSAFFLGLAIKVT